MERLDEAVSYFEEALQREATTRTWSWRVFTARDYARMLLTRQGAGNLERARELINEALRTAHAAGMTVLARQLEGLCP